MQVNEPAAPFSLEDYDIDDNEPSTKLGPQIQQTHTHTPYSAQTQPLNTTNILPSQPEPSQPTPGQSSRPHKAPSWLSDYYTSNLAQSPSPL